MIEQILTLTVASFVSAGIGTYVSTKLLTRDVAEIKANQKDLMPLKVTVAKTDKDVEAIKDLSKVHDERLRDHDKKFERAVWRDECGKNQSICSKHNDERWEDMKERMGDLKESFNDCFDNLVSELKKDSK